MVYQREKEDLRTRLHLPPETTPANGGIEDVLAHMAQTDDLRKLVNLNIYNRVETVKLSEEQSAIIGRSDSQTGFTPDVDLMRYNARKHGVSREHACLYLRGGNLYLMDMGSNNGTFICGARLMPHHAQMIQTGDVIRLGLLEIRIEIP
jgi:pSer/pThr/pTyr-binding forkhead associated (FHA) protein